MKPYILSVITASVMCACVCGIGAKLQCKARLEMLCNLFLCLVILSPLPKIDLDSLVGTFLQNSQLDGQSISTMGNVSSANAMEAIIKEKTQAYILSKAAEYDAVLEVTVLLDDGEIPVPNSVILRGSISPYAKQQLIRILEQDLNIPKENQQWTN